MRELLPVVEAFTNGLWQRLISASPAAIGGGGQHSPKSRPPAALTAVALVIEVTAASREGADELVGQTADVPSNLMGIARSLVRNPDADVAKWWLDAVNEWSDRALKALGIVPQMTDYVRSECPSCGAVAVVIRRQGERQRVPALEVLWDCADIEAPRVARVLCRACGNCWERTGDGLVDLAHQMNPDLLAYRSNP